MWEYLLVFICSVLVDIVPLPLPPAFTVMIYFQIKFDLNIWLVILVGVAGSVLGRYMLTLYIPYVTGKIFNKEKSDDVEFLGKRMKQKGWKGQLFVLMYSLMPLPTTPLFIAGGMTKMKPVLIIMPFIIGKLISDLIAVMIGKYAAENTGSLVHGMISWKSVTGFILGLLLVFVLIFIDWQTLLIKKKVKLNFKVFRKNEEGKNKTGRIT